MRKIELKQKKKHKVNCLFCHKSLCAMNIGKFYSFECGCKEEKKYYRTS